MNWFRNLKTLNKLMMGFALTCAIGALIGYIGIRNMDRINSMLVSLYQRDMLGLSAVKEANINLIYVGRAARQAVIDTDMAAMQKDADDIERFFSQMNSELDKAEKTLVSEDAKADMAKLKEAIPEYRARVKDVLRLTMANDNKAAAETLAKAKLVADRVDQLMTEVSRTKERIGKQSYENSDAVYTDSMRTLIGLAIVGTLLGLGLGYIIATLIANPMKQAVAVLESVAGGDLTVAMQADTRDEVGQMGQALNRAVDSMRSALSEVRASADSVATASQELAAASEELSSGTQEQASNLEETAASLEEMTSTVRQNADNARQANQLAGGSREAAQNGGEVVNSAVAAMGEINAASKRIADIITAIDEIAFQTNLLALNAAVEAARAGEQGRGFAVVAAEVRNLAQRSATAAKEIKALIQDSVRKVENGSDLVNQSGKTLHEIVTSVKRVTDIVAEIAAASQEQATGIEQVNKAMTQMDQVTQANTSQTEELSSTAQELSAHSEQLQAMVARFRLEKDGAGRTAMHAAPKRATPLVHSPAPHKKVALVPASGNGTAHKPVPAGAFEEF